MILQFRGQKVMLDRDLAALYGVVFDALRELMHALVHAAVVDDTMGLKLADHVVDRQ